MPRPYRPRPWLPWLIAGPLLFAAGAATGLWIPDLRSEPGATGQVGLPSLAPLVDRVKGGVVSIRALSTDEAGAQTEGGVITGTGFVIHEQGLVVTNHHLVANADLIIVYLPGYLPRWAEVVGDDPVTDLAVLRLDDPPGDLTVLELGRSEDLRQGDWVWTLGNPFNRFQQTLTVGVVSFLGRQLPAGRVTHDYVQFSAAVNPGSSGGPVLDTDGLVVGVTTRAGIADGLSFAIPSKTVKWALEAMETSEDGRVHWGFIGVTLESLSRDSIQEGQEGALVTAVTQGEPADDAGLQELDVVISFNGTPIGNAADLHSWILSSKPGATASLEVLRNGRAIEPVQVVLGEVQAGKTSGVTH